MSILSRFAAKALIALSALPSLRGASASPETPEPVALVHEAQDQILAEMDVQCVAASHREYSARYTGPRTAFTDQIAAMTGRKLANGCLGARDEFNRFVAERTRE